MNTPPGKTIVPSIPPAGRKPRPPVERKKKRRTPASNGVRCPSRKGWKSITEQ
ncbi:hypothetical protein D3C87_280340 [compost metagenome]